MWLWICINPGWELLQEHEVFKRYLALCTGRVEPQEGAAILSEKVQSFQSQSSVGFLVTLVYPSGP